MSTFRDARVLAVARAAASRRLGADLPADARARLVEEMAAAAVIAARRECAPPPPCAPPAYASAPLRARCAALLPESVVARVRGGRAAVVDGFAPAAAVAAARAAVESLPLAKTLQAAVGARDDAVAWVDENSAPPPLAACVAALRAAGARLDGAHPGWLAAPQRAMVAVYEPGGRYARHRDRGPRNGRAVTAILYLNPGDWTEGDGGCLVVDETSRNAAPPAARAARAVAVAPLGGRLVLFPSDLEHEVRPAARRRAALTLWFTDGDA